MMDQDEHWMQMAIQAAVQAEALGEVPVGAVVVKDNEVIGQGYNLTVSSHDPSAHAEVVAMRMAGVNMKNYRLLGSTMYVTLEPCMMCVGAMVHARIERVVFGAYDSKTGALGSATSAHMMQHLNHQLRVTGGILQQECGELLRIFFENRRR